jgi:hypothetical protein
MAGTALFGGLIDLTTGINHHSSRPGLTRASTPRGEAVRVFVDGRVKPGHDEVMKSILAAIAN